MKNIILINLTGKSLLFIAFLCIGCSSPQAQNIKADLYNLENGIALQGYDPVSYFENDIPIKGDEKFNVKIDGGTYLFANNGNLEKFKASPETYAPEYGGWCAYAMGLDGSKVKIDPKTYKIIDNNLYLFYNFHLSNTLKKWNKNEHELKELADRFWDKIMENSQVIR